MSINDINKLNGFNGFNATKKAVGMHTPNEPVATISKRDRLKIENRIKTNKNKLRLLKLNLGSYKETIKIVEKSIIQWNNPALTKSRYNPKIDKFRKLVASTQIKIAKLETEIQYDLSRFTGIDPIKIGTPAPAVLPANQESLNRPKKKRIERIHDIIENPLPKDFIRPVDSVKNGIPDIIDDSPRPTIPTEHCFPINYDNIPTLSKVKTAVDNKLDIKDQKDRGHITPVGEFFSIPALRVEPKTETGTIIGLRSKLVQKQQTQVMKNIPSAYVIGICLILGFLMYNG